MGILDSVGGNVEMGLTQVAFDREPLPLLTPQIACQLDGATPKLPEVLPPQERGGQFEVTTAFPAEEERVMFGQRLQLDDSIGVQGDPVRSSNLVGVSLNKPAWAMIRCAPTHLATSQTLWKRPSKNHRVDPVAGDKAGMIIPTERPHGIA